MKIIDGHDVIEHAEVNGESREFIRKLTDYIEDADEVETLYCCDRKKCENCNSDCFLTRDKSHAGKPTSVIIIDGIEMGPSVVEPKQGEWIAKTENYHSHWECSECGGWALLEYNEQMCLSKYCPDCGARMKGADDE